MEISLKILIKVDTLGLKWGKFKIFDGPSVSDIPTSTRMVGVGIACPWNKGQEVWT